MDFWACGAVDLSLVMTITNILRLGFQWPCEDREDGE